jgi:parvulin-like peptidyl-prolyl isomerase
MARRDRTTGLPKARVRPEETARSPLARFASERGQRLAIIGGSAAVLLLIVAFLAYQLYDRQIAQPNKVVLSIGDEDVKLSYYADRLDQYIQANAQSGSTLQLLAEDLLSTLEREAILVQLARDKGITLTTDEVTAFIARQLNVPVGGAGSSFDVLYRSQLKSLKLSDTNYRRVKTAELALEKLQAKFTEEIGTKGEQFTIQTVVLTSKEDADRIFSRAQAGEDLGQLAQEASKDPQSRQNNGLNLPEPRELLPESISAAIEGKQPGELLGPVQVQSAWWVFKIDRKEEVDYSEAQKTDLLTRRLEAAVAAKRTQLASQIKRNLDADDLDWAVGNPN